MIRTVLLILLLVTSVSAQRWYDVEVVRDGDSVRLVGIKKPLRLIGVAAPELTIMVIQADGTKRREINPDGVAAKNHLTQLLVGQKVRTGYERKSRFDRFGRRLAYVWTEGKVFVNEAMIKSGSAPMERRFRTRFKSQFIKAEDEARAARLGLWKTLDK